MEEREELYEPEYQINLPGVDPEVEGEVPEETQEGSESESIGEEEEAEGEDEEEGEKEKVPEKLTLGEKIYNVVYYAACVFLILCIVVKKVDPLRKKVHFYLQNSINTHENPILMKARCDVLKGISGTVLSFGSGNGANFHCFENSGIDHYVGVDFNELLHPTLTANYEKHGLSFQLSQYKHLQEIPAELQFDAIITTHTLCSQRKVDTTLHELNRFLKPEGKLYFLEHVKAEKWSKRWWLQRAVEWLWKIPDNCRFMDLETPMRDVLIKDYKYEDIRFDKMDLGHSLYVAEPHIMGVWQKPKSTVNRMPVD